MEPPTSSCLLICQDVSSGIIDARHVPTGIVDRIRLGDTPAMVGPLAAYIRLSNVYPAQEISLTFARSGTDDELFRLGARSPSNSDPLETHTLVLPIPPFEIGMAGRSVFQALHAQVPFAQCAVEVSVAVQEEA